MLDPRLHTFLTLCETMNYTRAAERLCLTQPAVTHHIHFLEQHYHVRLFSYQGKTLRLTEQGAKQRDLVRPLWVNSEKIDEIMATPSPVFLRIGATRTIGEYCMAPLCSRFLRAHPGASFSLTVDNTQALLRLLEAGKLDFALVEGFFDQSKYESRPLKQESFFGICAPHHPLSGQKVALDTLLKERLFVREAGSGTRAVLEQALRQQNRTVQHFAFLTVVSDFSTIKALVADGLGISFVYAPVVEQDLQNHTLARFDLDTGPLWGTFSFVCLKNHVLASNFAEWTVE